MAETAESLAPETTAAADKLPNPVVDVLKNFIQQVQSLFMQDVLCFCIMRWKLISVDTTGIHIIVVLFTHLHTSSSSTSTVGVRGFRKKNFVGHILKHVVFDIKQTCNDKIFISDVQLNSTEISLRV